MKKKYLLAPGPTPVLPEALLTMSAEIIHHRTSEFEAVLAEVRAGLRKLFQTGNDVLTLACSGTGAMEAAVNNFLSRGDKAIAVRGGKFGERWSQLCQAYGVEAINVDVEWGTAVSPAEIEKLLKENPEVKAVYTTFSETSTGVKTDIKAIAEIVREYPGTILVTDAITAVGVMDFPVDRWGVDVVVTGSQKAMMLPPGLAFISVSDKAWKLREGSDLPKFYFDLAKERKSESKNQTAFTPAISLILGLRECLKAMEAEGYDNLFKRHRMLADATREAVKALGLKLLAPDCPSDALTAVYSPEGISAGEITSRMSGKYGITIAGGQDHLKGKIFRIAHLGYVGRFDTITAISALEMILLELGYRFELGAGVTAAEKVLTAAGS